MIAKLVTHAPTRAAAIDAQARALDAFVHRRHPPQHSVPLGADAASALARRASCRPASSPRNFPTGFQPLAPEGETAQRIAAVAAAIDHVAGRAQAPDLRPDGTAAPVKFERDRAVWLGEPSATTLDGRRRRRGHRSCALGRTAHAHRGLEVALEAGRSGVDRHCRRRAGRGAGAPDPQRLSSSRIAASRSRPTSTPSARPRWPR